MAATPGNLNALTYLKTYNMEIAALLLKKNQASTLIERTIYTRRNFNFHFLQLFKSYI